MTNVNSNQKFKYQIFYFCILSFDIDLKFGF